MRLDVDRLPGGGQDHGPTRGASSQLQSAVIMPTRGSREVVPAISPDSASTRSDKLTLAQLCTELQIARSTFYDWRAKGRAPKCIKLPNGDLRVRRSDLDRWLAQLEDAAS